MFGHQNISRHFPQLERSNGSFKPDKFTWPLKNKQLILEKWPISLAQPGIDMASEAEYHRNMDQKKMWMRCCEANK